MLHSSNPIIEHKVLMKKNKFYALFILLLLGVHLIVTEAIAQTGNTDQSIDEHFNREITIKEIQESFSKLKTPKSASFSPWTEGSIEIPIAELAKATIYQITPLKNNNILIGMKANKGGEGSYNYILKINKNGSIDRSFGHDGLYEADYLSRHDSHNLRPYELSTGSVVYTKPWLGNTALIRLKENGNNDSWLNSNIKLNSFYSGDISIREIENQKLIIGGRIWDSSSESSVLAIRSYSLMGDINKKHPGKSDSAVILKIENYIPVPKALVVDSKGGVIVYGKSPQGKDILLWVSQSGEIYAKKELSNFEKFISLNMDSTDGIFLVTKRNKNSNGIYRLKLVVSRKDEYDIEIAPLDFLEIPHYAGDIQSVTRNESSEWLIAAADSNNTGSPIIFKLTNEGKRNQTFGEEGVISVTKPFNKAELSHLSIDNRGRVLAIVSTPINGVDSAVLYRFNSKNELDLEFGNRGTVKILTSSSFSLVRAILDSEGSIFLLVDQNGTTKLIKLNSDGEYIDEFGLHGVVNINDIKPNNMTMDEQGRVLIVGSKENKSFLGLGATKYSMIARINSNGLLDKTFGDNGIVMMDLEYEEFRGHNYIKSIKVLKNGRILIGAESTTNTGFISLNLRSAYIVVSINNDGTIDQSFGDNGIIRILNDVDLLLSPGHTGFLTIEKFIYYDNNQMYIINIHDIDGKRLSRFTISGDAVSISPYGEVAVASITNDKLVISSIGINKSTKEQYISSSHKLLLDRKNTSSKVAILSSKFAVYGIVSKDKLLLFQAQFKN